MLFAKYSRQFCNLLDGFITLFWMHIATCFILWHHHDITLQVEGRRIDFTLNPSWSQHHSAGPPLNKSEPQRRGLLQQFFRSSYQLPSHVDSTSDMSHAYHICIRGVDEMLVSANMKKISTDRHEWGRSTTMRIKIYMEGFTMSAGGSQ